MKREREVMNVSLWSTGIARGVARLALSAIVIATGSSGCKKSLPDIIVWDAACSDSDLDTVTNSDGTSDGGGGSDTDTDTTTTTRTDTDTNTDTADNPSGATDNDDTETDTEGTGDDGGDVRSDSETDTRTDTGAATDTDTGTDTTTDTDSGADTNTRTGTDAGSDTNTGTASDTDTYSCDWLPVTINANAASCGQQCVNPAEDEDCDGLGNIAGDPWIEECNPLLFSEAFDSPPFSAPARWNQAGGEIEWSCGQVLLKESSAMFLADPVTWLSADRYLMEMKFTLGEAQNDDFWQISFVNRFQDGHSTIVCEMWVHPTYQPDPGLHTASPCSGTWTDSSFSAEVGDTYLLQASWDGINEICRLLDEERQEVAYKKTGDCQQLPGEGRSLLVQTVNRDAAVHYVRLFGEP